MKATLKYGTPLHMCRHGYLKTLSNSKKKDKIDVCYRARLGCRGATHPPQLGLAYAFIIGSKTKKKEICRLISFCKNDKKLIQ